MKNNSPRYFKINRLILNVGVDICSLFYWIIQKLTKDGIYNLWENVELVNDNKAKLIYFKPDEKLYTGVSVIVCPGGSYYHLGMNHEGYQVAKWLNSKGISAFVLKYRTARNLWKHPAMIQDLQRSIQYVRENAIDYKIKQNSIGVMGFSAGGHLAGMASLYYDENFMQSLDVIPKVSLKPDFTILVYPVVTMNENIVHAKSKMNLLGDSKDVSILDKFSLEKNTFKDMPQTLIVHAKDDSVVNCENSLQLSLSIDKVQGNSKLVLFEKGGHGFGFRKVRKSAMKLKLIIEEWMSDIDFLNKNSNL